ncbi:alpha/beta hydrolase [Parasphingorhabdus sp.]|uniref:alpha/beta hydrolase family protein n=1 Tax=Parasphingorhabdus sp. TaxID=2709688 RepID=UPI003266B417
MNGKGRAGNIPQLALTLTRRAALVGFGTMASAAVAHKSRLGSSAPIVTKITLRADDDRAITIFDWSPTRCAVGTIFFSHGAGSSPDKYTRLIEPWVMQGWRVLAPLHVDSRDHPDTGNYAGLASWKTRLEDLRALSAYLGGEHYVAAGHSYGGLVALTLGGAQSIPPQGVTRPLHDDKVQAVVAFSPPAPIPVLVTREGYAEISVPAFIQTGTLDIVPGITDDSKDGWKGHLVPYDAAAAGGHRYGLVLAGVDHYFGGAICDYDKAGPPQLAQLDAAVSLSSLFLRAHGLNQNGARKGLEERITDRLPIRLLGK